jgi:rhodopsin domain-containing protein
MYADIMASVAYGYGKHFDTLPKSYRIPVGKLFFAAEPLWVWEVTFIKISIAFMFLRFTRVVTWKLAWKITMWFSITYLVVSAIIVAYYQFTACVPLRYSWDKSLTNGHCRDPKVVQIGIIGTSIPFIISDFQFSLIPLTFVLKLNRPLGERIAIACIMGMGLLASIVGSIKFIHIQKVKATHDPTWDLITWKVASSAEAGIGIIAANVPPLKSRGEKLARSLRSRFSAVSHSISWMAHSQRTEDSPSNQWVGLDDISEDKQSNVGGYSLSPQVIKKNSTIMEVKLKEVQEYAY